jgi:hypothetical protein
MRDRSCDRCGVITPLIFECELAPNNAVRKILIRVTRFNDFNSLT